MPNAESSPAGHDVDVELLDGLPSLAGEIGRALIPARRGGPDGTLPDREWAVGGPVTVADDEATARSLLRHTREVPALTWGRQVPPTRDMWNSNSLVSWLLRVSGVPLADLSPPMGGRASGWAAGIALAATSAPSPTD